ncbi:carbamoyltransferase C-terminal domain-containing protein [Nostoc sphaeroides]|nr:carbamoyltransferase C-terminal domain-containing protein [Nostoc sphaeroides]
MLLGDVHSEFQLTGAGVRILLFDSGIGFPCGLGERLHNLASLQGLSESSTDENFHALRGASICAEGKEANDLEGSPLGIAPRATILSALYRPLFPNGYQNFLKSVVERYGPIDVTGHAYSAPEDYYLAHQGRAEFLALSESDPNLSSLTIAAAGHDGSKGIRFPACCESVIAVGVHGSDLRPASYCGVASQVRKPELLVPDLRYLARLENGKLGTLSGTSAAVAIVTGLAALWCERLCIAGHKPVPALVRAALLASSKPSEDPNHRIASVCKELQGIVSFFAMYEPIERVRQKNLEFKAVESGIIKIAAVARCGKQMHLWIPILPTVSLSVTKHESKVVLKGEGWSLAEFEITAGESFKLNIDIAGPVENVALIVLGSCIEIPSVALAKQCSPKVSNLNIVGISASHDAAACLIRNGRLEYAIQLERITRIKRDGVGFLHTREAVDYCLQASGLRPRDIDFFAFNAQPLIPNYVGLNQPVANEDFDLFDPYGKQSIFVSHHLAHAFGAFFASPFKEAAVFVADGSGGSTVGTDDLLLTGLELADYLEQKLEQRPKLHVQSTYIFDPSGYRLVHREYADSFNVRCGSSSLGEVYAAVSQYIFGDWHEGGKLMGLAPYGQPEACSPSFLERDSNGNLQFSVRWKQLFCKAIGIKNPMDLCHLAARIQRDLEDALLERMRRVIEQTGLRNIVYTGGIALNSVVNQRLKAEAGINQLFVLPASSDAGIAIGAAAAANYRITNSTEREFFESDFLGYEYRECDYQTAIAAYETSLKCEEVNIADVAERLEVGQIIGWFEGRSEFGPRALGHRSILADPRNKDTWVYINQRIKFREDFRPFAPVVPVEVAAKYFVLDDPSPYMLRVVPVRLQYREKLAAITHVDGSARVQTVEKKILPRLHELLWAFGNKTGIPVLINTSMNVRGKPIVETPLQAVELLLSTHLSALVLGSTLVLPKRIEVDKLTYSHRIKLAPDTQVMYESTPEGPKAKLVARNRNNSEYVITSWVFLILANANESITLGELLQLYRPQEITEEEALKLLTSFYTLRFILICDSE